jgi:predicted DsbA family dithiol-disulfide isomerase
LAVDEAREVLGSDQYAAEVRADEAVARELGITGVPFFVVGGKYALSGAQPVEQFQKILEKAWSEVPRNG